MESYPTDHRGVPKTPLALSECYDTCPLNNDFEADRHHLAFNRNLYKSRTQRAYRQAGCMIVASCMCKHFGLHQKYQAPPKPSEEVMHDVAQGDYQPIECYIELPTRGELRQHYLQRHPNEGAA